MRRPDIFNAENNLRTYVQVLILFSLLFFALSAFGTSVPIPKKTDLERANLEAEAILAQVCPQGIKHYYIHQRDPRANPRAIAEFDNDGNPSVVGIPWRLMKAPRPTIGQTYRVPIRSAERGFSCKATEVYSQETCEIAYVIHFGGTPLPNQIANIETIQLHSRAPGVASLAPHARTIDRRRKSDAFVIASLDALAEQMKKTEPIRYDQLTNYRGKNWIGLPVTEQSGTPWDFCDNQEAETVHSIVEPTLPD